MSIIIFADITDKNESHQNQTFFELRSIRLSNSNQNQTFFLTAQIPAQQMGTAGRPHDGVRCGGAEPLSPAGGDNTHESGHPLRGPRLSR